MLTAVWVAVVAAAAAFVVGVGVAIYVMLKAARLMTESSATLASLREREDLVIERASIAIDRVGEQIAMTETITASMDGSPPAPRHRQHGRTARPHDRAHPGGAASPDGTRGALTWSAALTYGLARALGLRWAAQYRFIRRRQPGARASRRQPGPRGRPGQGRPGNGGRATDGRATDGRAATAGPRVAGQRRAALNGRRGGVSR